MIWTAYLLFQVSAPVRKFRHLVENGLRINHFVETCGMNSDLTKDIPDRNPDDYLVEEHRKWIVRDIGQKNQKKKPMAMWRLTIVQKCGLPKGKLFFILRVTNTPYGVTGVHAYKSFIRMCFT